MVVGGCGVSPDLEDGSLGPFGGCPSLVCFGGVWKRERGFKVFLLSPSSSPPSGAGFKRPLEFLCFPSLFSGGFSGGPATFLPPLSFLCVQFSELELRRGLP